jgi:AcrR family transcriptional regulator
MPKIIDKKEKKTKILEASIRVFAKKGLSNTKMADIAEAADIGKGTIYEYFRSKNEILEASFQHFLEGVEKIFSSKLVGVSNPLEKLSSYILAWADVLESEYMDYVEIILDFWAEGIRTKGKFATADLPQYYSESRKLIQSILDECIKKKKIRSVDTEIVASIILGCLDGLIIQWFIDRDIFDMKTSVCTLAKIITEGLK